MLETKTTPMRTIFAYIEPGETPAAAFHKILTRPDGARKSIAMSIPIRDERLLARAEKDLRNGDEIEVTLETCWAEEGIPETLLDFAKAPASQGKTLLLAGRRHL